MNLFELLRSANIEDLDLPSNIAQKLRDQNQADCQKIYAAIQVYKTLHKCSLTGLTDEEIGILDQKFTDLFVANGLMKRKTAAVRPAAGATSKQQSVVVDRKQMTRPAVPTASNTRQMPEKTKPVNCSKTRPENRLEKMSEPAPTTSGSNPQSPLIAWENRLLPQLRKVELVGEIPVTKEDVEEISLLFSRVFNNRSEQAALDAIERNCPATFLVFMVGQGIFGYNCGDFWLAYEQALHRSINHSAFGKLFEKLLERFEKQQFCDLQERSFRYVSLVLAHSGIPIYCLKDFFSNIVQKGTLHPQLFALEGEELVEEILKHKTYTANTDQPILNFLEFGGRTAADLLDRSRKLLLAWQQTQLVLSPEDAGLPAHITEYFSVWTRENAFSLQERGPRTRLKRPQLSLQPWGLGIYLLLPSQPVSALGMNNIYWSVEAGSYKEEKIIVRTKPKGDQNETREITLRLSEVPENIVVNFFQGGNDFDWKINGYSPDNPILAFDPTTGYIQNHILARETWLLYPDDISLTILAGEGSLLEVLPDLPGEWSQYKLECWDLTSVQRLGLTRNGQLSWKDIRCQERLPQPTLEGGKIVPTDQEETLIPTYVGSPPSLRIPINRSEDLQTELSRWQIWVESVGTAAPDLTYKTSLANLAETICVVRDNIALIQLESPQFLDHKPVGTYHIAIKGPLGRDATLSFQILPEFDVTGLKDLYIPDCDRGPEDVSFSVWTSLLDSLDSLNSADGIEIKTEKPGSHHILVPAEISSVGLVIRRETLSHHFIQVPIYFRIKRLRWRLVGDNGMVENWTQKHSTLSIPDLIQEESPLLIIDLPGNDAGNLSLDLNLLDIQGHIIQQIKSVDHSVKSVNRFWRFDLSKIKHSVEMNDSPIFRLDLVVNNVTKGENEFNLPVMVFTQEIQISQFITEAYSSSEHYHLLVTWKEKKPLQSRALILWSLFCPWQAPIIEKIPDSVCEEYEFSISKTDHAEGIYRMQMVVVDPWAHSPPPPYPPASGLPGCHDVELSSPKECLKKLDQEITSTPDRFTTQFSHRIEISLIRQYMGETQESYHDLEVCCQNLLSASPRKILTLKTILDQIHSDKLGKEFGDHVVLPEVLNRLYSGMIGDEITLSEFTSILKYAPHSKDWPAATCEILVQLEDPKIRFRALIQLVAQDIDKAVIWITRLLQQSRLSYEDATELLFEEKPKATERLRTLKDDAIALQLLELLNRYNLFTGLPVVKVGNWVLTNAGWGKINGIVDPVTRISIDSFLENDGKYLLSVALHINESRDLEGEKALINMVTNEIIFPRAKQVFICNHCPEFATIQIELFKNHLSAAHENALISPGEHKSTIPLTSIQFHKNPQQKTREL